MILEKLEQAKKIEKIIIDRKECLKNFENGVISKISIRKFNDFNCEYKEVYFSINIPRKILKNAMIDFLKNDIENLSNKLNNLFRDECN